VNAAAQVLDFVGPFTQNVLVAALSDPDGAGAATAPLAAALRTKLAALTLSGPIGGAGSGVALTAPIASIGVTTAGLGVSDDVAYTSSSVATGAPAQSASLAFGPTATALPGSGAFDWLSGFTTASANQVLAADTERGQLNRTVTTVGGQPLTYNRLDTLVGLGGPISPDRPLQAVVVPELAPAVTDGAPTGTNVGVLHLGGVRATVSFADSTGGLVLDTVFDADGQAALVVSGGTITVKGTGLTAARRDVLANPRGLSVAQSNGVVSALMADLVAPVVAGLPVVAAPTVPGLTLAVSGTSRFGSNLYVSGTYS
jgi:hypothetical protein